MYISQWEVKTFHQLTVDELFEVMQLRVEVFVVEQHCPYPELDEFDRQAEVRHLSGRDEYGRLMAYVRILPPALRYPEVSIGRFVVKAEARGKGFGHQLLRQALTIVQGYWPGGAVRISAQEYIQRFYAHYGFTRVSDVYLEDGIPHVEMMRCSS